MTVRHVGIITIDAEIERETRVFRLTVDPSHAITIREERGDAQVPVVDPVALIAIVHELARAYLGWS